MRWKGTIDGHAMRRRRPFLHGSDHGCNINTYNDYTSSHLTVLIYSRLLYYRYILGYVT